MLVRGDGTDMLVFAYTVEATDDDDNGIWIGNHASGTKTFELGQGQSIRSVATGRDALLEHDVVGPQRNHKVNGALTGADTFLSALSLSGLDLNPTFAPGVTSYTAAAGAAVASTTVTATARQSGADVDIDPADADTNTTVHDVDILSGVNTVTVTVTGTNTTSSRVYTVTVSSLSPRAAVSADGASIAVSFPNGLDTGAALPAASVFEVVVDSGTAVSPTGVAYHDSDADTVVLTMGSAIAAGAVTEVTYNAPASGGLQHSASDRVATFTVVAGNRPAAPSPAVTARSRELTVAWTAPADGGSAITGYEVEYKLATAAESAYTAVSRADDTSLSETITGLTNDSSYTVRVRAVNAAGDGPWSAEQSAAPTASGTLTVPANWALLPSGLSADDEFRLLFVTSDRRNARSSDISDYNDFVQDAAASGHPAIRHRSGAFRALGSTEAVDAIVNTHTSYSAAAPGVAIWWLNGPQIADGYADLYDGNWDHEDPGRNQHGSERDFESRELVLTGTNNTDGTEGFSGNSSRALGSSGGVYGGHPGSGFPICCVAANRTGSGLFYGLSDVLVVGSEQASSDATLSGLTVDAATVAGFAADTTFYDVSVPVATTQVTVAATANDAAAVVFYEPDDADDTADGHQVDVPIGSTIVTVSVLAANGAVGDYTVEVVRPVTLEWSASDYTAIEGRPATEATLTLSGALDDDLSVPVTVTTGGGAVAGDYDVDMNADGTVTVDAGDTSKTITVTAVNDRFHEGSGETVTLAIGTLPNVAETGTQDETVVSLLDNDIESGSDLLPDNAAPGDEFRLLFVTSTSRNATSDDIDDYNDFVQSRAAAGHDDIEDYSDLFRALASTASISARDNTDTDHTSSEPGVPIYWLNGLEAADDYADFYDGSWDHADPGRDEAGDSVNFGGGSSVWTGTLANGDTSLSPLGNPDSTSSTAAIPEASGQEIFGTNVTKTFSAPLYGLSYVLQAALPDGPYVTAVEVHREPEAGVYTTGDTIEIAVTFSEDVAVGGMPTFPLEIGSVTVQAAYDAAESTATRLVFAHVVVAGETDANGISNAANLLVLPTGASITSTGTDPVDAYPGPLDLSTDLEVNSAPRILDVEVTSTPQFRSSSNLPEPDTYGLGEDIEITVTFSQTVSVTGDVTFGFSAGGAERAPLKSGNDTAELVFVYTVEPGKTDANGIWIGNHSTGTKTFDLQPGQMIVGVATDLDALLEHGTKETQEDHKVDATETGADATLSALSLSGIDLDQTFAPGVTAYTATVANSVASTTVMATARQSAAAVTINGNSTTVHDVSLDASDDTITVVVTPPTASLRTRTYTITVTVEVDTTPPSVSHAFVSADGMSVNIVFDEELDDLPLPAPSQFPVTVDATAATVTGVELSGDENDNTITLTMAAAIAAGTTVTVGYTQPTGTTALVGLEGNKVATFAGVEATHGLPVTAEFGADSHTAVEGGDAVTVTVTLSADPERDVTIPIAATGAGAGDYSLSSETVTIDSGSTSGSFTVTATDDDVLDGAKELTLSFGDLPSSVTAGTQATTAVDLIDNEILASSSLVPSGIDAGAGFRLLFVTSGTRDATSTDIDDYNEFVQTAAAGGHTDIQPYSVLFRALASTDAVDARDNTATTHTTAQAGVPIWWLNGPKAADDYADFYDDDWNHLNPVREEDGNSQRFGANDWVWTGSTDDGTEASGFALGDSPTVAVGAPGFETDNQFEGAIADPSTSRHLYGLSFVLYAASAVSSDADLSDLTVDHGTGAASVGRLRRGHDRVHRDRRPRHDPGHCGGHPVGQQRERDLQPRRRRHRHGGPPGGPGRGQDRGDGHGHCRGRHDHRGLHGELPPPGGAPRLEPAARRRAHRRVVPGADRDLHHSRRHLGRHRRLRRPRAVSAGRRGPRRHRRLRPAVQGAGRDQGRRAPQEPHRHRPDERRRRRADLVAERPQSRRRLRRLL